MSEAPPKAREPADSGAPDWIVPHRDWKLGQSDKTTAGCLWFIVLGVVLYGLSTLFYIAFNARGPAPASAVVTVVFAPIAIALVVVVGFVRLMSTGRWAGYTRLAARLRRAHPTWARVRLKEPPMRVFGLPVLWGRRGVCHLAPDRVVLLVRRVHPLLAGLAFALPFQAIPRLATGGFLSDGLATGASTAVLLISVALFLLSGVDVYEIRLADIERTDAEDGHVTWTQNGGDGPRVLRLRVTHPDDAAVKSQWLSRGGAAAST